MNNHCRLLTTMLMSVAFCASANCVEQAWPVRPVHIVVAGDPGGVIDIRARWLAERLTPLLGQPVIVDDRGGAGGNIGTAAVAHSAPDGYTLLFVHQGTMAINPHLYARPGYDPLADFSPITRVGVGPLLLTVNGDLPVKSVAELVQLAKAKPGVLNYGSPGIGTPPHLASELFKRAAGIEATHVPFKGGGALMTALLGGQLTWSMDVMNAQLPQVQSGRLRPLAVTGLHRLHALPDVPTIAEAGFPGYRYESWSGLAAPARTPAPVIARLSAEVLKILATPEAAAYFASLGLDAGGQTPQEFGSFIRAEYAKWGAVIQETGIRAE